MSKLPRWRGPKLAAHALQTDRIILTFDTNARFGDLPGVSATSL